MAILVIEACRTAAETMVHGRVKVLDLAFFIGKEQQELWKRDGRSADFFLEIADEREGTHLYDDYQKELAEAPVTEDKEKEHRESAQAVLAELERLNIADEQRRKDEEGRKRGQEFYKLPFTSDLIIQLGDYPQSKGSMEPKKRLYPISR
uniref:hypothetical protein n=1 Tax=Faecalibacterium prausnitzii TaxID=853 RepID=UPI003FED4919